VGTVLIRHVPGARYYYFRAVMHYHTDDKCLEILKNVIGAMTKDSILLIDEVVVPSKDASWYITQNDLSKMVQFSSMDRTEEQWRQLLIRAGLVIRNVVTYHRLFGLSVIAATT
jgi:demethylsterigmatocystin 6-O-methyltransferase